MKDLRIIKKIINIGYISFSNVLALAVCPFFLFMDLVSKYCCGRFITIALIVGYIPFEFGERLRYFFYKCSLDKVGEDVKFMFGSFCNYRDITIGNRVLIGYYNSIGRVTIGSDVLLGGYVNILSGKAQHGYTNPDMPIRQQQGSISQVMIGSDVWIGSNSVVMNNIGSRCVVAAGTIVVKEVENQTVVAGNPGKFIRRIS